MKTFTKSKLAAAVGTATLVLTVSAPADAQDDTESSFNITGWINEGVVYFDDGELTDVVQTSDNGTTLGSRITFAGETDVPGGLTAGFDVTVEPLANETPLIEANQETFDDLLGSDIGVLGSSVHVSGAFGKFTVGNQSMPTDNIAVLADPSLTLWPSISPVFRGNGFFIQGDGGALGSGGAVWGDFLGCLTGPVLQGAGGIGIDCNGVFRNGVRYDLPTFVDGLGIAAGWANDEIFDAAVKYNGETGGLRYIVHAGYAVNNDPDRAAIGGGLTGAGNADAVFYDKADQVQVQGGLMHTPTGLFGTVAFQTEEADLTPTGQAIGYGDDTDAWWVKAGVKRGFTTVGDTAFAFQYGQYNDQFGGINNTLGAGAVTGSEIVRMGLEVSQYFGDKLIIYGVWENLELNDVEGPGSGQFAGAEDLNTFTLGLTYFF